MPFEPVSLSRDEDAVPEKGYEEGGRAQSQSRQAGLLVAVRNTGARAGPMPRQRDYC